MHQIIRKHLAGKHNQEDHAGKKQLSAAQIEQRRAAGRARGAQMTSAQMIEMRKLVKPESLSASGKKGFASLVAKYGRDVGAKTLALHRLKNPSGPERAVIDILTSERVDFAREHQLKEKENSSGLFVDFFFPQKNVILEVDEKVWHTDDAFHADPTRVVRDLVKEKTAKKMGIKLFRVTADDIKAGRAKDLLRTYGILP